MSDPTTVNIQLAVPTRGSDVGTWDVPVNGDMTILDACAGSITTKALTSGTTALTITEAQVNVIRLTGTLTGNAAITIPGIYKSWSVQNLCTVGAFAVTIGLAAGGAVVGLPPGEIIEVVTDGTDFFYRNLGRVGEYWDYAGATVPAWVTASTVPPYLLIDGSTFSSGTYPQLAAILGTTTLVDGRGRFRATLNGGTGRITTAGSGIDGDTRFSTGGAQNLAITQANLPNVNFTVSGITLTNTSFTLGFGITTYTNIGTSPGGGASSFVLSSPSGSAALPNTNSNVTVASQGTASSGGSGTAYNKMPPTYIGGITMIRAA